MKIYKILLFICMLTFLSQIQCDDINEVVKKINKVQSEKIETFKRVNEVLNTLKCKLRKITGYESLFPKSKSHFSKVPETVRVITRNDYENTLKQIKDFLGEFEYKHLPKLIEEVGSYNILKNEPSEISKMTTIPAEQVYNYGRGITIVFDNVRASVKHYSKGKIDIPNNICDTS